MPRPAEGAPSSLPRALRPTVAFLAKLGRVSLAAIQRFFGDGCPQHAAGIAYRVLFSIAPLAIVLISIFGLVLQDDGIRKDVVDRIVSALPVSAAGRHDVEKAITAIASPASAVGLLSLVVFAWAATGMMAAIRQGLESAMAVEQGRPLFRGKLVDIVLVVGAAVLVIGNVALTLLGDLVDRATIPLARAIGLGEHTLAGGLLRAESFGLSVAAVLLLYRFVPARSLRWRDGLIGAIVTGALLQLISFASSVIYDRTTQLSIVYGSLTAALVFLYSIYLYSSALLFGAEIAAAWSRPPEVDPEPLGVQVKRFLLGLFIPQTPLERRAEEEGDADRPP